MLDLRPAIHAIIADIARSRSTAEIAACFHNTLSAAIIEICCRIQRAEGLNRVCLSGGTFQNMYLLQRVVAGLRRKGFEVFLHTIVPANDGGIALGQAVIANERIRLGI